MKTFTESPTPPSRRIRAGLLLLAGVLLLGALTCAMQVAVTWALIMLVDRPKEAAAAGVALSGLFFRRRLGALFRKLCRAIAPHARLCRCGAAVSTHAAR